MIITSMTAKMAAAIKRVLSAGFLWTACGATGALWDTTCFGFMIKLFQQEV